MKYIKIKWNKTKQHKNTQMFKKKRLVNKTSKVTTKTIQSVLSYSQIAVLQIVYLKIKNGNFISNYMSRMFSPCFRVFY